MAEIPIEKKGGGIPWWVWLVLAALLIALAVWIFGDNDRGDGALESPAVVTGEAIAPVGAENALAPVDPAAGGTAAAGTAAAGSAAGGAAAAAPGGPITNLDQLIGAPADAVVGREVRLTNVPAGPVPNDAGFWITGANGREYVILHEVRTPNTPIEGKINVDKGNRLDIIGTVRSAAEGVPKNAAIPGPTAPLPAGVVHYIDAQSVTQALSRR